MKKTYEQIYPFGSQHPKVTKVSEQNPKAPAPPVYKKLSRPSSSMAYLRSLGSRKGRGEPTNPQEKALQQSALIRVKKFTGGPNMTPRVAESKAQDRIYTMAFIKEAKNLSKEEKLDLLEFVYTEPDIKKVLMVVEKYVELDDSIWSRVVEATKQAKSLFYTKPAGKKMLKFAGKPPKAANKQLSKVMARE